MKEFMCNHCAVMHSIGNCITVIKPSKQIIRVCQRCWKIFCINEVNPKSETRNLDMINFELETDYSLLDRMRWLKMAWGDFKKPETIKSIVYAIGIEVSSSKFISFIETNVNRTVTNILRELTLTKQENAMKSKKPMKEGMLTKGSKKEKGCK